MGNLDQNLKKESEFGITTGSAATAAALAAFLSLKQINENISSVYIQTPIGELKIDVECYKKLTDTSGRACILKRQYNDPDVTKNIRICADVRITQTPHIKIKGGDGVGIVTKPGLQVPVGKSAINPIPESMIRNNLKKVISSNQGVEVTINVPKGTEIAKKTMNSKLGIIGGISILGTTGIARSMSSEAYKQSLTCQIDVAIAQGYKNLVFVPGNIGENLAKQILDVEDDRIIQMGNFVGYMLKEASKKGVEKITLFGHAGKLVKIAAGIFNTKHSVADGRREVIAAHAGILGAKRELMQSIFNSRTTEEIIDILDNENMLNDVFGSIAESIEEKCREKYKIDFDVIIVRMDGTILNYP